MAAAAIVVAVWISLYLATPLPALGPRTAAGAPWRRWDLLLHYLLLPDELVAQWFGSPAEFALLDRLPIVAGAAVILTIAGLAGWSLLRLTGVCQGLTRLETALFSLGIGLSAVSLHTAVIGVVGAIRKPGAFLIPAVSVVIIAAFLWWRKRRADSVEIPAEEDAPRSLLSARWLWLGAPIVAVVLLGGMLPPADFDAREYHLQAPKEFYQLGRIEFLPHNVYANMPLGAEMFCLLAMTVLKDWWLGALVGKTVMAAFMPLTALALFAFGRRFISPAAGVVAALVYLSLPGMTIISVSGLNEGALSFYALLALHMGLLWSRYTGASQSSQWRLIACGVLAGGALACKYPAAVFVVLPLAFFTLLARSAFGPPAQDHSGTRPLLSNLQYPVLFLLTALLSGGPWFLKNALETGNPVYPLMYNILNGETRTPELNAQWQRAHSPPNFRPDDLIGRLIDLTLRGESASLIMVPLAGVALVDRRRRRLVASLAGYLAFFFIAWWLLTHRIERFFAPALPIAALLAGIGAETILAAGWRKSLIGALACAAATCFVFAASPEGYAAAPGSPVAFVRYFVGLERLRNSPERIDPWHLYLNQKVSPESSVLLVGDAAVFDLRMPVYYNTVFDACVFEQLARGRTSQEIGQVLAERNIAWIYVDWADIGRYRSPGNYGFTPFVQPEVFQKLVTDGVLKPAILTHELIRAGIVEPPADGGRLEHPGELYPVVRVSPRPANE